MCRNHDPSKNLCPRSDVDMPFEHRNASAPSRSKRDLLEDKAIDADLRLWVDYDPIRMRYCEAASNSAVDGDVGSGHNAPKAVLENIEFAAQLCEHTTAARTTLVATNGFKKLLSWLPEAGHRLARPVSFRSGNLCAICEVSHLCVLGFQETSISLGYLDCLRRAIRFLRFGFRPPTLALIMRVTAGQCSALLRQKPFSHHWASGTKEPVS